jgi:hypothetical protein
MQSGLENGVQPWAAMLPNDFNTKTQLSFACRFLFGCRRSGDKCDGASRRIRKARGNGRGVLRPSAALTTALRQTKAPEHWQTSRRCRAVRWRWIPAAASERWPVVLREGERPLLGLFVMMQAGDLPEAMRKRTWSESPLIIHAADGSVHPEYAAVKLAFGFPP